MMDFEKRLEEFKADFGNRYRQWANVALGSTALAMILRRWRETGTAPDGQPYKPYSQKNLVLHADMFLNNTAKTTAYKEAQWFTTRGGESFAYLPGGYRRLRDIHGLQTKHKDFTYSAQLIKSLGPNTADIKTMPTPQGFETVCASRTNDGKEKLEHIEKREGKELLMVTKKEEEELTRVLDEYITNVFKKMFND